MKVLFRVSPSTTTVFSMGQPWQTPCGQRVATPGA